MYSLPGLAGFRTDNYRLRVPATFATIEGVVELALAFVLTLAFVLVPVMLALPVTLPAMLALLASCVVL